MASKEGYRKNVYYCNLEGLKQDTKIFGIVDSRPNFERAEFIDAEPLFKVEIRDYK
jgi:hypothetical protein